MLESINMHLKKIKEITIQMESEGKLIDYLENYKHDTDLSSLLNELQKLTYDEIKGKIYYIRISRCRKSRRGNKISQHPRRFSTLFSWNIFYAQRDNHTTTRSYKPFSIFKNTIRMLRNHFIWQSRPEWQKRVNFFLI